MLADGCRVKVHSLKSAAAAELNGREGTAMHFNKKRGRWAVKVDGEPEGKMILANNLQVLPVEQSEADSVDLYEPARG